MVDCGGLETVELRGSGGSNPSLSAKVLRIDSKRGLFSSPSYLLVVIVTRFWMQLSLAQLLIAFQPQFAVVFDYFGRLLNTIHVHLQLLRSHVKLGAVRCFISICFRHGSVKMFSIWLSSNTSISFVESVRIRSCITTGSWMSNSHPVIDVIERMVEIDYGLRRELRRPRRTLRLSTNASCACSNRSLPSVRKVSKWNLASA